MTHLVRPPLPRSTAEVIHAVAGRLPPPRPARPEMLASQGPSAKPPSRPPEDVRSSETASDSRRHASRRYLKLHGSPVCLDSPHRLEREAVLGCGERS